MSSIKCNHDIDGTYDDPQQQAMLTGLHSDGDPSGSGFSGPHFPFDRYLAPLPDPLRKTS